MHATAARPARLNRPERILVIFMRIRAAIMLLALAAVVMPEAWMADLHARLGLGTFPHAPLVAYLTRSLSALYAVHGGVMLLLSFDVRRYAPVITGVACVELAFGLILLFIDLSIPMPLSWTLGEGPVIMLMAAAILLLQWLARPAP